MHIAIPQLVTAAQLGIEARRPQSSIRRAIRAGLIKPDYIGAGRILLFEPSKVAEITRILNPEQEASK